MGDTIYITGFRNREQAHICIYHCDHPAGCVTDGEIYPARHRCALERYLDDQINISTGVDMPDGHLSIREVAERLRISTDKVRRWAKIGKFHGARKLGPYRSSPWAIPTESLKKGV